MSDLDNAYLSAMRRVNAQREDEEWDRLLGRPPGEAQAEEKNVAEKFLGGVTKGMRQVPNVFRPPEQGGDVIGRVGEALALPFTIPYEGLMQGLVESGAITEDTKKNLTNSLMGALPAMISPKGPMRPGTLLKENPPGKIRITKGGPGKMAAEESLRSTLQEKIQEGHGQNVLGDILENPEYVDILTESERRAILADELRSWRAANIRTKTLDISDSSSMGGKPLDSFPNEEIRVNLNRITAGKEVKNVIANVNKLNAERLAEHRKPQSHEVTLGKAEHITVEEALAMPEDTAKLPETGVKLRRVAVSAAEELTDVAKRVTQGDEQAAAQLLDTLAVAGELEARSEVAKRNVARTTEAFKIEAEAAPGPFDPSLVADLAQRYAGMEGADPVVLAERLLELNTTQRRATLARQVRGYAKAGMDALHELYVNMLLTPSSHVANILGNTMVDVWVVAERAVAGAIPTGPVSLGEAAGMIRAIPEGFLDGLKAVKEYGWTKPERSKVEITSEPKITSAAFNLEGTFVGRWFDYMGSIARINTTLLGAEDAFFKGLNFRMELKAQAIREATAQRLTGDAFRAKVAEVEARPDLYPSIYEAAEQFKLVQTFQDEMGPIGESIQYARSTIPGARFIMPFLRTPNRIAYWATQRVPGVNLPFVLAGQMGADLVAGGAARQLAAAKITTGAAATAAIAYYAANGLITGTGPKDKELLAMKKQAGWLPNSIKVGDTYYGYNRLDPFGLMVGMVADFTDMVGHLPEAQADEVGLAFALSFANNFVSKTYLQGLSDMMETIADPKANAHAYAKNFVRGLVPGAVRAAERTIDPSMREANTLLEAIQAQVPGWSEGLPPQRNLFGQPVLSPPGFGPDWLSPVSTGQETTDPVAKEIERLGMRISRAPRAVYGTKPPMFQMEEPRASEGVQLTPQEYDHFVRLAGNELKVNGKGMHDALADLITTERYKQASEGPEGGKAEYIRTVVMEYREAAREQLLKDADDLRDLIEQKIRYRAQLLQPAAR